jgi:hypothetical protein
MLGLSQSRLARLSGVSRFKICTYELGNGALSQDEQNRIREALQAEAERLRSISIQSEFGRPPLLCRQGRRAVVEERRHSPGVSAPPAFEEHHCPVAYWARLWGFSHKTVRDWFRDEYGPGILRQPNIGRRKKRITPP